LNRQLLAALRLDRTQIHDLREVIRLARRFANPLHPHHPNGCHSHDNLLKSVRKLQTVGSVHKMQTVVKMQMVAYCQHSTGDRAMELDELMEEAKQKSGLSQNKLSVRIGL